MLASLGHYRWETVAGHRYSGYDSQSSFGGSLGGGVRVHAKGPLWLGAEGRWHHTVSRLETLTRDEPRPAGTLWSLSAGAAVTW